MHGPGLRYQAKLSEVHTEVRFSLDREMILGWNLYDILFLSVSSYPFYVVSY